MLGLPQGRRFPTASGVTGTDLLFRPQARARLAYALIAERAGWLFPALARGKISNQIWAKPVPQDSISNDAPRRAIECVGRARKIKPSPSGTAWFPVECRTVPMCGIQRFREKWTLWQLRGLSFGAVGVLRRAGKCNKSGEFSSLSPFGSTNWRSEVAERGGFELLVRSGRSLGRISLRPVAPQNGNFRDKAGDFRRSGPRNPRCRGDGDPCSPQKSAILGQFSCFSRHLPVSVHWMAGDAVLIGPVSGQIPCKQGIEGIWRFWWLGEPPTCYKTL